RSGGARRSRDREAPDRLHGDLGGARGCPYPEDVPPQQGKRERTPAGAAEQMVVRAHRESPESPEAPLARPSLELAHVAFPAEELDVEQVAEHAKRAVQPRVRGKLKRVVHGIESLEARDAEAARDRALQQHLRTRRAYPRRPRETPMNL